MSRLFTGGFDDFAAFFLALAEELIEGVVACVLSSEATMNEPMIFSFFGSTCF